MHVLTRPWGAMNYRIDGPETGPVVVFANSLGSDLRLWDNLLPYLPSAVRVLRYDKCGHGLSDVAGALTIGSLAEDAVALIEAIAGEPVVFVGLSVGGMIGQAVAAKRPDLVRALVLSNTAAKIGTYASWQERVEAINRGGLGAVANNILDRWFPKPFRDSAEASLWRNMLVRTQPAGYTAICCALASADLTESTRDLKLPCLAIAGSKDGSTPPALVSATAALIEGADFQCIDDTGHLPCVDAPDAYAELLVPFLKQHCGV